jgi:acetoin utilization deacetylase AcuC-like enzyme
VNLPLPGGAGDGEYGAVFDRIVVPVLRAFAPQLILVSAGFDAHADDPLASMQLSSGAYALFTQRLLSVAEECCAGRLVLALEGGYDLPALGASVAASVGALCAEAVPWQPFPPPRPSWEPVVAKLREAHAQTWPVLRGASTHLPRISRSNDS